MNESKIPTASNQSKERLDTLAAISKATECYRETLFDATAKYAEVVGNELDKCKSDLVDGIVKNLDGRNFSGVLSLRIRHFNDRAEQEGMSKKLYEHFAQTLKGVDCSRPEIRAEVEIFYRRCSGTLSSSETKNNLDVKISCISAIETLELHKDPYLYRQLYNLRLRLEANPEIIIRLDRLLESAKEIHAIS